MPPLPPVRVSAVPDPLAIVSLALAKQHLRVDHDEDDARITLAIGAAVSHLDGWGGILGRALLTQTWRQRFGAWAGAGGFDLVLAPVASIGSVKYRPPGGVIGTVDENAYRLRETATGVRLVMASGFAAPALDGNDDALAIEFVAGYGATADAVPAAIRQAILLMVGDSYRFTESGVAGAFAQAPSSVTVDRLLAPFRRVSV